MTTENEKDQSEKNEAEIPPQQEENEQELTPSESEEDDIEEWIREVTESAETKIEDIKNWDDLSAKDGDLPKWIGEILLENGEIPNQGQGSNEPISFKANTDSWSAETISEEQKVEIEKQSPIDRNETDDEFVEISNYEISPDFPDESYELSKGLMNNNEEIPEWLEEMIEEPEALADEEIHSPPEENIRLNDEPTKPVLITEIFTDEDALSPDEMGDEVPVPPQETQEEIQDHWIYEEELKESEEPRLDEISAQEEIELTKDEGEWLPEETITPPMIADEQKEEEIQAEFAALNLEEEKSIIIPKTLRFAKYLLDQGEYDAAYEIFQTYIKKQEHLQEIKGWVKDAIDEKDRSISQLWELLGDIAQKQDQPNEALSSYASAIAILLNK